MQEDREHLKILGICTIAHGAITGIAAVITFAYMCVLAATADSAIAGGVVAVLGLIIGGLFFVQCLITIASGIGLMQHKWRWLSYLSAVLSCLNVPMGTVLAVFTFLVLDRASVRAMYEGRAFVPAPVVPFVRPSRTAPMHTTRPDSPLRVRVVG